MSLDDKYGPCVPNARTIDDWEKAHRPTSLDELTAETGKALNQYMQSLLKMPRIAHSTCVILWIVDGAGRIWFALEELFSEATSTLVAVRPRGDWGKIAGTFKLGHPSLLTDADKSARIGGEIVYNSDKTRWEINNFSGRYGVREKTKRAHLEAVAGKFTEHGIPLYVDFAKP
jgi:hypothetical protein